MGFVNDVIKIGDLIKFKTAAAPLGLVTDIFLRGYKVHFVVLFCDGSGKRALRDNDYNLERA